MNAIIGIGFETTFKKVFEAGKTLNIFVKDLNFDTRLVETLKTKFSTDSLYIFYSKTRGSVGIFEKILNVGRPFSLIDSIDSTHSESFDNIKGYIDPQTKIGVCVFATDELPKQYYTATDSESSEFEV